MRCTYFVNADVTDFFSVSFTLHLVQVAIHLSPAALKSWNANFITTGTFSEAAIFHTSLTCKQERELHLCISAATYHAILNDTVKSLLPALALTLQFDASKWQGQGRRSPAGPRPRPNIAAYCYNSKEFSGQTFQTSVYVSKTKHRSSSCCHTTTHGCFTCLLP